MSRIQEWAASHHPGKAYIYLHNGNLVMFENQGTVIKIHKANGVHYIPIK